MSIKLVALDLDGTTLGRDLQIPTRTRSAIAAARAKGVQFIIATGRMYQSARPYARQLELDGLPLIAYNGALVVRYPSAETIFHEPVPLEKCKALAAFCETQNLHLQAYADDLLYVPDMGKYTQEYTRISGVRAHEVGSLFFWLNEPSTKMLIVTEAERMAGVQAEVKQLLGDEVDVYPGHPTFLEVVSAKVSKGAALAATAAHMGVDRSEVLAIGDAMNDLSMLQWAGTSFAMAHAPEALRNVATHVTTEGPGEGVAEALERLGLV